MGALFAEDFEGRCLLYSFEEGEELGQDGVDYAGGGCADLGNLDRWVVNSLPYELRIYSTWTTVNERRLCEYLARGSSHD